MGVENQVLGLHVTVALAVSMHVVEGIEHLIEVVASLGLTEAATKRNKVKELATTDKLKYDEVDFFFAFTCVSLDTAANLDQVHDVGMVE